MTKIGNFNTPVPYRNAEKSGKAQEEISVESAMGGKDMSKATKGDAKSSLSNSLAALRQNTLNSFLQFLLDSLGDGKNQLAGGKGDDRLRSPSDDSVIDGGDGNDDIATYDHSYVQGGSGKDKISTYDHAIAFGGYGDDDISTYDHSYIDGGAGNDRVSTCDHSVVFGGAGDDVIHAYDHAEIDGGDGNDRIRTYDHAKIDGGAGDDSITAGANSTVFGGAGNDVISGSNSVLSGGQGDDTIYALGASTVHYAAGDGRDRLVVNTGASTLALGEGLTRDNMQVSVSGNVATIRFAGNDTDTITVEFAVNTTVNSAVVGPNKEILPGTPSSADALTIAFADGSTQVIRPEALAHEMGGSAAQHNMAFLRHIAGL